MQLKRLAIITVAYVMLVLVIAVPASAAGEQGTGTLYAYTDPERTTLVEVDSNGRYYVVPGTEYYFKISGITEYTVGQEATVWAYRVNTAEDVIVGNVVVTSDSSVVLNWIIPEDWLDEVVKIKYGSSLEGDWVYAQKEIWVNCRIGTGILKVYVPENNEAPLDAAGNYLVYPGVLYHFEIDGITEYPSQTVHVWAFYRVEGTTVNVHVTAYPPTVEFIEFDWTIPPDLPIETSIKFKYGTAYTGPKPAWYFARRDTISAPRLLLVIPGVFLGSIGAITALFSGWAVKTLLTKRR